MRKILVSAFSLLATFVSAGKISVMAQSDTKILYSDSTKGLFQVGYAADIGYGANTGYSVDPETNAVSASATAGLYSNLDLILETQVYGLLDFNVKVTIVPIAVNAISTSAQWTHPIALSQGEEMTGTISAGYDFTIGDVQIYYYINNLVPKVSILDYLLGETPSLLPGDITQSTLWNSAGFGIYPFGNAWNLDQNYAWNADPYLHFNLGDWINENTDLSLITEGDYIEPIDLFAEYNETK